MAKKGGKIDKHGHNFIIFSQANGQTWYHTSAYHLSPLEFLKLGLHLSCKDGKHTVATTFFKLFMCAFVFGLHIPIVVMITCNSIHISQEIFVIDVLTALKSSLEQRMKHVLGLLRLYGDQAQADQCKEQFSGVITCRYCLRSFAGSPISIILSHKFELNTVPGSGPGS